MNNLKVIQVLFGDLSKNAKMRKEVSYSIRQLKNCDITHFVLGKTNKRFLITNGVLKSKIILVKESPTFYPEDYSNFNKTFLLKSACEYFFDKELLYLDYDCILLKDFNKKNVYDIIQNNKFDFQSPPAIYRRHRLRNSQGRKQKWGLCSCLFYCRNHKIIQQWFKIHSKIMTKCDEIPLLCALEEFYGIQTISSLYNFDTRLIKTIRRPMQVNEYNKEHYENSYFWHH